MAAAEAASQREKQTTSRVGGADIEQVRIFDTTLRDGEQSPGFSLNLGEKLEFARRSAAWAWTSSRPASRSPLPATSRRCRRSPARSTARSSAGLARCNPADIDRAGRRCSDAERPRIHVFLATSDIHLRVHSSSMTPRADRQGPAREAVAQAKGYCDDVEFSPDGRRPHRVDFLCRGRRDAHRRRARRRSTSPTPSATRCPTNTRAHPASTSTCRGHRDIVHLACTATTTWAWPLPTGWPRSRPARGRSNARSTASASGPATPRSKRSSWR